MKTALKIVGVLVACAVVLLVIFRITGFGPHGRTPGLWLSGTVVTTPVSDWSFASKYFTLEIQTRTPYLLPHSVTAACITYMGQLYVGSIYEPGLQYPHGRNWNENVARDPHVRVKVGDHLYDATLVHITDPTFVASVLEAEQARYRGFRVPPGGSLQLFHVVQTGAPVAANRDEPAIAMHTVRPRHLLVFDDSQLGVGERDENTPKDNWNTVSVRHLTVGRVQNYRA